MIPQKGMAVREGYGRLIIFSQLGRLTATKHNKKTCILVGTDVPGGRVSQVIEIIIWLVVLGDNDQQ